MRLIIKKFANTSSWSNKELASWLNDLLDNPSDPNKIIDLNPEQINMINERFGSIIRRSSLKDLYKKFNNFESDIASHNFNQNYIEWMSKVNRKEETWVKLYLTPESLIGGYCEDFGLYWSIRYGIDLLFLNGEHNLIKYGNKYYDGYNTQGVSKLKDLQYVKDSDLKGKTEDELQDLLYIDEGWKNYKPLSDNIKLIERVSKKH